MNTTPRTDAALRKCTREKLDLHVLAGEMAILETELIYLRNENKQLKVAQKISEERDEQLIQEARSLQSLGAILAAYDVSVKTRKRLKTELEAMTVRAEKAEADTARLDWLEREALEDWGIRSIDRVSIDAAMKESIEVPDSVSIEARNPTGGVE